MNILYASFWYPLDEPIALSEKLGFVFDNPRTEDEIELVAEHIKNTVEAGSGFDYPEGMPPIFEPSFLADHIATTLPLRKPGSEHILHSYNPEKYWIFLAKIQIVIRYDKARFPKNPVQEKREGIARKKLEGQEYSFFPYENESRKAQKILINYIHLLSFLLWSASHDMVFIIDEFGLDASSRRPISDYAICLSKVGWRNNPAINQDFFNYTVGIGLFEEEIDGIAALAQRLDAVLERVDRDKLLYTASLLYAAQDHTKADERVQILCLVSILELLLTHSPDFNRYNVEDSINKQFQLKVALVMHYNDNTINLKDTKGRLKLIYSIRSAVAHGDNKRLQKLFENNSSEQHLDLFLHKIVDELHNYVRAVILVYIDQKSLIEFLKES